MRGSRTDFLVSTTRIIVVFPFDAVEPGNSIDWTVSGPFIMSGTIFVNYRREDDPGSAGRLFDWLERAFCPTNFSWMSKSMEGGVDFIRVLESQVAQCDVLLAVIGPTWLSHRLEDEDDFVRVEVAAAIKLGKRVIPVLVNGAHMPRASELPQSIKKLAHRNAVRLTHEEFKADVQGLIKTIGNALKDALSERANERAVGDASWWNKLKKRRTPIRKEHAPLISKIIEAASH